MFEEWLIAYGTSTVRAATPLLLCALGVVLAERAGVIFIGVEGAMLGGALFGMLGVVFLGNTFTGVMLSLLFGILLGLIYAYVVVCLPTNQIVSGLLFYLLVMGVTSFIFRFLAEIEPAVQRTIPAVEPWFLGLSPFTITAVILTLVLWWFLYKTGGGLLLRSVGEDAFSAHVAGVNVVGLRFLVVVIASALAALGGAAFLIGWVRSYTANVTMARGFIALAAVYCGRWHPLWGALVCVIFGAGEALAFRAMGMGLGISSPYFLMIPYILTIIIVGLAGKGRAPADVGNPYTWR